jgi:hypothetical protein
MPERQLDLFEGSGIPPSSARTGVGVGPRTAPAGLDDPALIGALPWAGLIEAQDLATEVARRRLAAAIPALEQLCRRFAGFGLERPVPEQVAALRALGQIGGAEAARAVARLIVTDAVQGPGRKLALSIAADLGAALPAQTVLALMEHPDPAIRANACRCAGPWPASAPLLLALMRDGDPEVATAALCALGRMGRAEARSGLIRLLRDAPTHAVIEAVIMVADEDAIILLGRIARTRPALASAAREALEAIDHPRARQVLDAMGAPPSE